MNRNTILNIAGEPDIFVPQYPKYLRTKVFKNRDVMGAARRIRGLGKPYNFRSNTIALNLKNWSANTVVTSIQVIAPSSFTTFFREIRRAESKTLELRGMRLIQGKSLKVSEGATLIGFADVMLSFPPTPAPSVPTGCQSATKLKSHHI